MSVYAKKNSKGEPTGQWVIEVTRDGKRLREFTYDFREAKTIEQAMLSGRAHSVTDGHTAPAASYLVEHLKRDAREVWRRTKDETQSLQRFEDCMDLLGLDRPIKTIYTSHLDKLVADLRAKGLADSTIHRYLCTVSAALRWACEHHEETGLKSLPVFPWKRLKKGEPRETVLHPEDDARLLDWTRSKGSPDIGIICEVLMLTGMRIGELRQLTADDFDERDSTVTIGNWDGGTKNGDRRKNPLPPDLLKKALALATVGWPSYRRINSAFHRARTQLGIKHKLTPHVLRHTVVTRLNKAKVPVATIMDLVGHRSIATTKRYTHPDIEDMKSATESLGRMSKDVEEAV